MLVLWPIRKLGSEEGQYPGVMTMSAVLRAQGFQVEAIEADANAIQRRIADARSTVLAYSTMTVNAREYVELNARVKECNPAVLSVFGGAHPTYFPEMIHSDGVDAVCIGEGEHAMLDLVQARASGQPMTGIANWWIKVDGRVEKNPVRPLIGDLDALPPPDRSIFRRASAHPPLHAIVMTGRGCPYGCTYCYNHVFKELYRGKGKPVRRRSVDHVLAELAELKTEGYRFIRFMDDLFILDRQWVLDFAERYRRQIGLPFSCLVRANLVTEEIVAALAAAGCHRMMMGIESGSERIRQDILNRNMSDREILDAARTIRAAGVRLVTANILGIPTATIEEDWRTVELNHKARPSYASASVLQAFPGTKIHAMAEELQLLRSDHMDRLGGLGSPSALRRTDPNQDRQITNLAHLFPLVVWLPSLTPLARIAVRAPSNAVFRLVHRVCYFIGSHLIAIPMPVGRAILGRKLQQRLRRLFRPRRQKVASA